MKIDEEQCNMLEDQYGSAEDLMFILSDAGGQINTIISLYRQTWSKLHKSDIDLIQ